MKPRIRTLSSLYHRWGRAAGLETWEVATALHNAKAIELITNEKDEVTHYRETERFALLSSPVYESTIRSILATFKTNPNGVFGYE